MNYKEKLDAEKKKFKGGTPASAIKDSVYTTLIYFCEKEPEFAQAVEQSDKTLSDCCEACVKGCGNSISDLEVYKRAAKFYFETADVSFIMQIDLSGNNGHVKPSTPAKAALNVSLDDLLDF